MSFSLSDYGPNPNAESSANGDNGWGPYAWPQGVPNSLLGFATYKGIRVVVRKELVRLFELFFEIADLRGYTIHTHNPNGNGEPWGPWSYDNRPIAGTNSPSNHSRARAVDVNAPYNPQSRQFVTNIPPALARDWEYIGFYWGGRYTGVKFDTMHWEYAYGPLIVGLHEARAMQIIAALRSAPDASTIVAPPAPAPAPVPAPAPAPVSDWLRLGFKSEPVKQLQTRLNVYGAGLQVDGDFGPATDRAVKAFQSAHGLDPDGIVGPLTWAAVHVDPNPYPGTLIREGSTGAAVKQVQQRVGVAADGQFGPRTKAAVVAFQRSRGLGADGIVGPATWKAMFA